MSTSLFALLDDIATVLDDVAAMTKVAAGRTAGVLGDDLALNAEQVSGVRADRELPVVWAVFKGSARNKGILVPLALLLAAFAPFLIQPLLILGGCYLCFEGFEKVFAKYLHPGEEDTTAAQVVSALRNPDIDLVEFEQEKITGAIRTDFVLSAEIIVISMGTVQDAAFITQVFTVITMAVLMTIGVYGLVAGIVKLDDAGLHLTQTADGNKFQAWTGERILDFAPYLMKGLSIVGTAAMFLVGGGIILHGNAPLHHVLQVLLVSIEALPGGSALPLLTTLVANAVTGLIAGGVLVALLTLFNRIRTREGGDPGV
tara:strand:+ start:452 stop:1396 length:945 start_codon:yes stop_codon:yes gene_type:complete